MKTSVKIFVSLVFVLILGGCEKEANRKLLNGFFKYDADGAPINITEGILLNENTFTCTISGDTALQIMTSKIYDGAGFYLKDLKGLKDGTYTLNQVNKGFYLHPKDFKTYYTNSVKTGMVTIKRGTFQAKTLLNTLEGTFDFIATDSTTRKQVHVSKGSFLMELKIK